MTEILLYHLDRQPLEKVLPNLLARSRDRGWRALVKVGNEARMAALDDHLWTYQDESFLPHGTDREGDVDDQPVLLTLADANPNGAQVLFVADGAAVPEAIGDFARVVLMLDGHDEAALADGRITWRRLREAGHDVTYWQQDDEGRWHKKA